MPKALLIRGLAAVGAASLTVGLLNVGASASIDPETAGQAYAWGVSGSEPVLVPETVASTAVAQVAAIGTHAMYLTASGKVISQTSDEVFALPGTLAGKSVATVSSGGSNFAAVTKDGDLVMWGAGGLATSPPDGLDLSNLTQVSLGGGFGVGLRENGTVVAWGNNTDGQTTVPAGLDNVVKIAAGFDHTYALKADGSLVAWGRDQAGQVTLPASTTAPGSVVDVAARTNGGLALLSNGTVVSWGQFTSGRGTLYNLPPASLDGKTIVRIAAGEIGSNAVVDSDGNITVWGNATTAPTAVPAGLDGRTLTSLIVTGGAAYAVQAKVMTISASAVAGTAKQGSKLTGTPATFSGGPEVAHQWLANGTPIAGATATTLTLTAAQVGKKITFRTTAAKDGDSIFSDSSPTATVTALVPPKVSSKTVISKPKVKKTKASFTVKVTRSGGTPTGKVKITVKRGAKKVYSKSVTLKKGVAKVALKKLKKGKHKVTASYAGDSRSKSSSAKAQTFRVK